MMSTFTIIAQQMCITGFARTGKCTQKSDKDMATLNLLTSENGFTFKADGKTEVKPVQSDGKVTLLLPPGISFLEVQHSTYGAIQWKCPEKLKKGKVYQCNLQTASPKKEFKAGKQWVVFNVNPPRMILQVDSMPQQAVRTKQVQMYLPLGKHTYKAISPFYDDMTGSFTLNDSVKLVLPIDMHPVYSYISVTSPVKGSTIAIDGDTVGVESVVSNRVMAGSYLLSITKDNVCYYNQRISIAKAQKYVFAPTAEQMRPFAIPPKVSLEILAEINERQVKADSIACRTNHTGTDSVASVKLPPIEAKVQLLAADSITEIWINRECVAKGKWEGTLKQGLYAVNTAKDGIQSQIYHLWIVDDKPRSVKLSTPLSAYGVLSIDSDVIDADILINGINVGKTPLQLDDLPAEQDYKVTVMKPGYKKRSQLIHLRGNELNKLTINLKHH